MSSNARSATDRNRSVLSDIKFTRGSESERGRGLLGYLRVQYGELALDGLTLRRTAAGRLTISYPGRRDRAGQYHPYFRPADAEKRADFERQVLGAIGFDRISPWC